MIDSDAYLHLKNKKLKKTDKTDLYFKKMILIKYKNYSTYYLYNKKSNSIFVSCNVDVNKNSMLKNLIIIKIYKIECFIFKNFTIESFTVKFVKFDKFFASEFHEIKSSQINESINELIFKHMTSLIRNKYKNENKILKF